MLWTSRLLPFSAALIAAAMGASPAVATPVTADSSAISRGILAARPSPTMPDRLSSAVSAPAPPGLVPAPASAVGAAALTGGTPVPVAHASTAAQVTAPSPVPPISPTDQPGVGVPNPATVATVFLRAGASGTTCTLSAPCGTLGAALKVIGHNSATIEMAAGSYGKEDLYGMYAGQYGPVIVRPAPGAVATFSGALKIARPDVTLDHLSFAAPLYVYPSALRMTVYRAHFSGPDVSVLLRSSYGRVAGSIIEGGFAHDGVNVAGTTQTTGNVIEQNTIRNFAGGPAGSEHPDCIQIFDTSNLVVRRNILTNCYNSAITFSHGAGLGVSNVQINSNFLTGCMAELQRCGSGGSSIDLRLAVTGVTFANNTVGRGSVRMPFQAGVLAPDNIIGYFSTTDCTTSLRSSLLLGYSSSLCKSGVPGASVGNWTSSVTFVDPIHADLRVVGGAPVDGRGAPTAPGGATAANPSGAISYGAGAALPVSSTDPTMLDIDGAPFLPGVVGASNL